MGRLNVTGDVETEFINVTGLTGAIGAVNIGGSLISDGFADGGVISATDAVGMVRKFAGMWRRARSPPAEPLPASVSVDR